MDTPDLAAIQNGDMDAWDVAYDWLWPVAVAAAQTTLARFLPDSIEDVAIETLAVVVGKVVGLRSVDEIKPLTASIARNLSISRLREHLTQKRGSGKTASLDATDSEGQTIENPAAPEPPLNPLDQNELAGLLATLIQELKPEVRAIVTDFLLHGLDYQQLATKHNRPIGSIGVVLKRALETIRKTMERHPAILKELREYLRSS